MRMTRMTRTTRMTIRTTRRRKRKSPRRVLLRQNLRRVPRLSSRRRATTRTRRKKKSPRRKFRKRKNDAQNQIIMFLSLLGLSLSAPLYCNTDRKTNFTSGEPAILCLHFLPSNQRMAFNVTVDKYSALHANNTYQLMAPSPTTILLQLENTQLDSLPEGYPYITAAQKISNIYSFVVRIEKGVFVNITDDNQCLYCN